MLLPKTSEKKCEKMMLVNTFQSKGKLNIVCKCFQFGQSKTLSFRRVKAQMLCLGLCFLFVLLPNLPNVSFFSQKRAFSRSTGVTSRDQRFAEGRRFSQHNYTLWERRFCTEGNFHDFAPFLH